MCLVTRNYKYQYFYIHSFTEELQHKPFMIASVCVSPGHSSQHPCEEEEEEAQALKLAAIETDV